MLQNHRENFIKNVIKGSGRIRNNVKASYTVELSFKYKGEKYQTSVSGYISKLNHHPRKLRIDLKHS